MEQAFSGEKVIKKEERKSEKYQTGFFSTSYAGNWGSKIRENQPDQLHYAIMARIGHVSRRIDSYINTGYKVDQSLALNLENSFDELAQLYLEISKEGSGKYLEPLKEDGHYSYEPMKALDEKLEEIHDLIIKAEEPFFTEREGKFLVDPNAKLNEAKYQDYSEGEKKDLHEQGTTMLQSAVSKIKDLKNILESRASLV